MCSKALKVLLAPQERCLPLPIIQWAVKWKILSEWWLWIACDLCGLPTEVRRGFCDWIAHGQWARAEQAEWITCILCHSLHVSTQSPRFFSWCNNPSHNSVLSQATLLLVNMLSKFEIWLTNGLYIWMIFTFVTRTAPTAYCQSLRMLH